MRLDKTKGFLVVVAVGLVGLNGYAAWDLFQFKKNDQGGGARRLGKVLHGRYEKARKAKEKGQDTR